KEEVLEFIINSVKSNEKPYYVVTPNPEIIVLASKNADFKKVLNNAKIASNDGVGIGLAGRFLGKSLHRRVTGVELVEKLCEKCADWPITVGFLGAGPKIAEKAAECLKRKYPGLTIVVAQDEVFYGGSVTPHPCSTASQNAAGAQRGTPSRAT